MSLKISSVLMYLGFCAVMAIVGWILLYTGPGPIQILGCFLILFAVLMLIGGVFLALISAILS